MLQRAAMGLLPHQDVGSGSSVLLLQGIGLDARMCGAQVLALQRYHRVLAPDLQGSGPKGAEGGRVCPAEELFRLLSLKGIGPVHLVGSSLGGAVAVDLLAAHPEAIRTLVLVDALPTLREMARSSSTIPGGHLHFLDGLGHASEHVNRLLLGFLEGHDGGAIQLPSAPRLYFRTWTAADEGLAMRVWGDPRVTTFVLAEPFTSAQVVERLRQEMARQTRDRMQYFPIFLRASGDLVGCCGLRPRTSPRGVLELGFLLRPQYWGQGLATEAARAAAAHAFEVLGAATLFAGHHPENAGSRHVLEKLGFRPTHLEYYPPTGLNHPCYLLAKEDFLGVGQTSPEGR